MIFISKQILQNHKCLYNLHEYIVNDCVHLCYNIILMLIKRSTLFSYSIILLCTALTTVKQSCCFLGAFYKLVFNLE